MGTERKVPTAEELEGRVPQSERVIIKPNELDERLMDFQGRKQVFDGYAATACLHYNRQEKWLDQKKQEPVTQNNFGEEVHESEKEKQRKMIEVGKDLFMVWDSDGGGSLS